MGIVVGFSLRQFSEVFKIRDAEGRPYVLIGGQAVNYWAEHYLAIDPQLEKLQPFTSENLISEAVQPMSGALPSNWAWLPVIRQRCK